MLDCHRGQWVVRGQTFTYRYVIMRHHDEWNSGCGCPHLRKTCGRLEGRLGTFSWGQVIVDFMEKVCKNEQECLQWLK